jgi:purine-binding chemotaxis protein CheW
MPLQKYSERTCVIVVHIEDNFVGLVVDAVKEVASLPQSSISEAPRVARSESAQYIKGIGKVGDDVKIIVDVFKLVMDSEIMPAKSSATA